MIGAGMTIAAVGAHTDQRVVAAALAAEARLAAPAVFTELAFTACPPVAELGDALRVLGAGRALHSGRALSEHAVARSALGIGRAARAVPTIGANAGELEVARALLVLTVVV